LSGTVKTMATFRRDWQRTAQSFPPYSCKMKVSYFYEILLTFLLNGG